MYYAYSLQKQCCGYSYQDEGFFLLFHQNIYCWYAYHDEEFFLLLHKYIYSGYSLEKGGASNKHPHMFCFLVFFLFFLFCLLFFFVFFCFFLFFCLFFFCVVFLLLFFENQSFQETVVLSYLFFKGEASEGKRLVEY